VTSPHSTEPKGVGPHSVADRAWTQYAADFRAMSDADIESECDQCRNQVDEAESWLEAVASWERAGKPRTQDEQDAVIAKARGEQP
jgi:hypothetical protein